MKKIYNILILLLLSSISSFSNDGAFYSVGNTLIPLEETKIELKKEILIMTKQESLDHRNADLMDVCVYFEFYNPDSVTERLVGFVTPPADGVLDYSERDHPHIYNFSVEVNSVLQKFNISKIDSTNFRSISSDIKGDDYIYYTKVRFKNGINIIKHSYTYKGSALAMSCCPGPHFEYRLTTGTTWANKQIDDFELYINMGRNAYFSIPANFIKTEKSEWEIIGNGRIGNGGLTYDKKKYVVTVKIISGYLHYKSSNFRPEYDLTIGTKFPIYELQEYDEIIDPGKYSEPRKVSSLSDEDLRIIRNSLYALHGYEFNSPELLKYFSKYTWYIPDPNIIQENIKFDYLEQSIFNVITEEEKKRKSDIHK